MKPLFDSRTTPLGVEETKLKAPLVSLVLDAEEQLRRAGFVGYLEKPFSIRELPDLVRRFCGAA